MPHAAAQIGDGGIPPVLQINEPKQVGLLPLDVCLAHAIDLAKECDVLVHSQIQIQRCFLWHVSYSGEDGGIASPLAENKRLSAGGFEQAAEYFDGRGFARAVGTEQTVGLTALDFEIKMIDRRKIAKLLDQLAGFNC